MYSEEDMKVFHKNCEEGNLDEVKKALSKHPSFINEKGEYGKLIYLLKLFLS